MSAQPAPHKTTLTPLHATQQAKLQFATFGPPDVLVQVTEDAPVPGPGEVRIRVEASSVQFTDTLIRRGLYPDLKGEGPFTPGYDVVGRVDAVGSGASQWAVGDRVADLTMVSGNARYIVRPADGLVSVPESVDAAEAATLVLSWVSAQQAIFRAGGLQPGERLLIIGGNGAVGRAAIALGVAAGAEVYATASERHHDAIRAAGATPLPRDTWAEPVAALGGMDVVLDGVGVALFWTSYRALRRGGRLVFIGGSAAAGRGSKAGIIAAFVVAMLLYPLLPDGRRTRLYSITTLRKKHPDWFATDLEALFGRLADGDIRPTVAERLRMEDVPDAHRRLEAGGLSGKLVLVPE
jgi:NADPH:quinone reductase